MVKQVRLRRRSGMTLILVLVFLAVSMALIVGWARIAVLQTRQARAAEDRLQAIWLAESAVERAAERLLADPDYRGETWSVAADEFGRHSNGAASAGGIAVITVEPAAGDAQVRQVKVRADYPATGNHSSRVSKQVSVEMPSRGEAP